MSCELHRSPRDDVMSGYSLVHHTYSGEKIPMLKFLTSPHSWQTKPLLIISLEYILELHKLYMHDLF